MQRVEFADAGVAPWGKMETAIPKEWTPTALQSTQFSCGHTHAPRRDQGGAHIALLIGDVETLNDILPYGFTTPTF